MGSSHLFYTPSNIVLKMIALLDCNNFYVSCERLFNMKLINKPVVILSNNDGCVISRSNEAKKMGILMGEPFFKIKKKIRDLGIYVYSSNYSLYGDISERVMSIIKKQFSNVEIYSIDEVFIDLENKKDIGIILSELRNKLLKDVGIPVSIGISKTKTLSKIANRVVKKIDEYQLYSRFKGIFEVYSENNIDLVLKKTLVGNIWGIGKSLNYFLKYHNIINAYQLKNLNESFARKQKGLFLERTILELRGIKCYNIVNDDTKRKSICVSRSFGEKTSSYEVIRSALIVYVQRASEKLRRYGLYCKAIKVFLKTSRYEKNYYENSKDFLFSESTLDSRLIWSKANYLLKEIYMNNFFYNKVGVILFDLCNKKEIQKSLFQYKYKSDKNIENLMNNIDYINKKFGNGSIRISSDKSGLFHKKEFKKNMKCKWIMKSNFCSPCYTTKWVDIPKAKIG